MRVMLFNASPKAYGATQEILNIMKQALPAGSEVDDVCLGNVPLDFCLGCKQCYETGDCVRGGEVREILDRLNASYGIVERCDRMAHENADYLYNDLYSSYAQLFQTELADVTQTAKEIYQE